MGYETPVEMPSMGIYNTDLMKMYIAGVKDQYEKGQEEMKDFMKLYGDFYSPIAGDTQRYNDMTVGGARDMINQMLANGIDPYKSPEARAAISRYINSVPTGMLNAMKQNAENRKKYDEAVAQARLAGKLDPEYEAWALKQAHLDNFSTIGPNGEIRTWDRLAPDPKQEWAVVAAPYLKEFDKTEKLDSDVKGYTKWGVSDANKKAGVDAVMNAANSTPWLQYKLQQSYDRTAGLTDENGLPLSDEQRRALAVQDIRRQAEDTAAQYYQPKYEVDPYYKSDYETANNIRQYWATTGANPKPTSSGSSRRKGDVGDYSDDMSKYSKYASITQGTNDNLDRRANGGVVYTVSSKNGNKKRGLHAQYKEVFGKDGNKQKRLVVRVFNGGDFKDEKGNTYRLVTQREKQNIIYRNLKANNKDSALNRWRSVATRQEKTPEYDEAAITDELINRIYSPEEIMYGPEVGRRYTKILRDAITKSRNDGTLDNNLRVIPTTHYGDVAQKDNTIVKANEVQIILKNGTKLRGLEKIGQYDEYYNPNPQWLGYMGDRNRLESKAVVGESDSSELYNTNTVEF